MTSIIYSPIKITVPRKTKKDKVVALNLNTYRNLHFHVNNEVKRIYEETIKDQVKLLKPSLPISLFFQLYRKSKRKIDSSNVYCIVEKFFCDALVKYNIIPDDNDNYIDTRTYYPTIYSDEEVCKIVILGG
jgi:hypothetical protein